MKAAPGSVVSVETAFRQMSPNDFEMWGVRDVAFVKKVGGVSGVLWSIHAANGAEMGIAADRDLAFAAIRQYDLEPYSVH